MPSPTSFHVTPPPPPPCPLRSITYLTLLLFQRLGLLNIRMKAFYLARVIQTAVMGLIM